MDIADGPQPGLDGFGGLESGSQNDIVHFAHAAEPLVDVGDLDRQHETHRRPAGGRYLVLHRPFVLGFQAEQALFGRLQFLFQLIHPSRMNEIPGTHHPDTLQLGPLVEVLQVQVLAGRPRVMGVEMQIGVEGQGGPLFVDPSRIPSLGSTPFQVLPACKAPVGKMGEFTGTGKEFVRPGTRSQEAGVSTASADSMTCPLSLFRARATKARPSSRM